MKDFQVSDKPVFLHCSSFPGRFPEKERKKEGPLSLSEKRPYYVIKLFTSALSDMVNLNLHRIGELPQW
jgi:hypothetical protein